MVITQAFSATRMHLYTQLPFLLWLLVMGLMLTACLPIPLPATELPATGTELPATPVAATPVLVATVTVIAPSTPVATAPAINQPMERQAMNETLLRAAEQGDTATVLHLLAAGAKINSRDAYGRTPVMAATHGNRVETVGALIAAGADIDIQDNRLDNPFLYAGAEGLLEILKLTIDAGANTKLTNRFGGTALIPAAERGHIDVVTTLLTRTDVAVNHVNNLGWTALLEAIILSDGGPAHVEIVRLLIAAGADVNLADKEGVTPLAHAQQRGYSAIIELLQQAGAE